MSKNRPEKPEISRRSFMKSAAFGAGVLLHRRTPIMAGPFENTNQYLKLIPTDKKLNPDWLRSLTERGQKQIYSDPSALAHVGMPVGGLFAGTLYLGGDGRLWLWDIFNRDQEGINPRTVSYKGQAVPTRNGANYIEPAQPKPRFDQGFSLRIDNREIPFNSDGFEDITFRGEYPRAVISYHDQSLPVSVELEAFSPFIPLNTDDSSLPATIMQYTVKNTGPEPLSLEITGHLQNPICIDTAAKVRGRRRNRIIEDRNICTLCCDAVPAEQTDTVARPDILHEDFETDTYEKWTAEGESFGKGPILMKDIPAYQGDVAGKGDRVVNSHATAGGNSVGEKDNRTGTLTSEPFEILRKYITFLIGGGAHKAKTCMNLIVDGEVVASCTGKNNNRMERGIFDVRKFQGRSAVLQIVDAVAGGWGNIGVDHIVFTDKPDINAELSEQRDFGTMALSLLEPGHHTATADRDDSAEPASSRAGLTDELTGRIARRLELAPGRSNTTTFVVSWHFPNFYSRGCANRLVGHYYATKFASALDVARYIQKNFDRLAGDTRTWVETWYDSTLPFWFLDRTMANTAVLATTTCYRFESGRIWAWEGIGCCAGTCTHVWQYAQAPGRLFPEIERDIRERVDFGLAMHPDGGIGMRAGLTGSNQPAHDGQCGRILGVYREHRMSKDDAFLRRIWPNVKKAMQYMIAADANADGMVEGAQANTLDAAWFGKISFLASLYLAALRACEQMAREMDDWEFAKQCKTIADRGAETIIQTWNGEYFIQIEDPRHKNAIGTGEGCYIDQIYGQSWAHQVGLGHLFDPQKQRKALDALYKYNFVPDVGPFREIFERGRWYAAAGDAGLLMCTWPRGGQNPGFKKHWQYMYFNECMTGFEWQAASHMIAEGLLQQGLAVARAIHDRYDAALRNPYNEIECSDHYARSMASYGAFIAASGFQHHGPKRRIEFKPRLNPGNFKSAFTTAKGWGSFTQKRTDNNLEAEIHLRWGVLDLETITLQLAKSHRPTTVSAQIGPKTIPLEMQVKDRAITLTAEKQFTITSPQSLKIRII